MRGALGYAQWLIGVWRKRGGPSKLLSFRDATWDEGEEARPRPERPERDANRPTLENRTKMDRMVASSMATSKGKHRRRPDCRRATKPTFFSLLLFIIVVHHSASLTRFCSLPSATPALFLCRAQLLVRCPRPSRCSNPNRTHLPLPLLSRPRGSFAVPPWPSSGPWKRARRSCFSWKSLSL